MAVFGKRDGGATAATPSAERAAAPTGGAGPARPRAGLSLLRRRNQPAPAPVEERPASLISDEGRGAKKNRPTPTRREAERARMERLHPTLTVKEQKAADREAAAMRRMSAQLAVERAPERALLRNFVDSGWHVGEFSMPALLVLIAATFVATQSPLLTWIVTIAMWLLLLLVAVDIWWTWRRAKRLLTERLGTTSFRGLFTYTMNRVIQIRRFRSPAPVIKRGDTY